MTDRLTATLAAIDRANSADPTLEHDGEGEAPASLLYGRRMSAELQRIAPEASEPLRIAARGQHIERWKTPRSAYPEGRAGYHAWRKGLYVFHADRVAEIMAENGYQEAECERASFLVRKEAMKRDPEAQLLEDVVCLVFLRWYFADFAARRDPEQIVEIVKKTARKMSAEGRARVLAEFDLPPDLAAVVRA